MIAGIGKRWVAEVLVLIRNDVRRFSQLKERLAGISDNVLSTVLNDLVKEGLIEKKIFSEIRVRVEYKVTGKGRELTDLMSMLCKWGKTHIPFEIRMEPIQTVQQDKAEFIKSAFRYPRNSRTLGDLESLKP